MQIHSRTVRPPLARFVPRKKSANRAPPFGHRFGEKSSHVVLFRRRSGKRNRRRTTRTDAGGKTVDGSRTHFIGIERTRKRERSALRIRRRQQARYDRLYRQRVPPVYGRRRFCGQNGRQSRIPKRYTDFFSV